MRRIHSQLRDSQGFDLLKTGDVCPTDTVPIGTMRAGSNRLEMRPMAWGLPKWDGKGVIINARAETVVQKPMFRRAILANRAVIPTSGFYEWRAEPGQAQKTRYLFRHPKDSLLHLAGFFTTSPERFAVLTTAANASVAPYHDRMPVIIERREVEDWIKGRPTIHEFLKRTPISLTVIPA